MKFIKSVKKKNLILLIIITVIISIIGFFMTSNGKVDVEIFEVETGNVFEMIEEVGVVKARFKRVLKSEINGTLETLLVDSGDFVNHGDKLAVIDVKDMDIEIAKLNSKKASLTAEISEAKRIDPNILKQLTASKNSAFSNFQITKRHYEQNLILFESGGISKSQLENSKNQMEIDRESYEAANAAYLKLTSGLSKEMQSKYNSELQVIDYQLMSLANTKNKYSIYAPFDGIITEKFVEVGDILEIGSHLIEIIDEKSKYLETDILVSDARKIKIGTKCIISDENYSAERTGIVTKIFPKAIDKTSDLGIQQKRVRIEIDLDDDIESKDYLGLGYETDIKIISNEKINVLRIPETAAFKINKQWNVFFVDKGKVKLRKVSIGLEGKDYYEILEGLLKKDFVVNSPENELENGNRVNVKKYY